MVDAAVGGKAVLAFGLESDLGIMGGDPYPFRFDSAEFSRDSKENPSTAITGHGGRDKGTPGAVEFGGKLKFDLTTFRLALMLRSQYGKPDVESLKHIASIAVGAGGSGYLTVPTVTITGGGGAGATAHAVLTANAVSSVVVDTPGYGYTSAPTIGFTGGSGTGATATATLSTADAYLAKFRPGDTQAVIGSLWAYLDEGGSYSAQVQLGRRPSELSISEDSNKRLKVDATFAPATGDSISGFLIAKASNTGDVDNDTAEIKKFTTRGRRDYDADYTAGKSIYLKVTARDANTVTVAAQLDAASGHTDGTSFPSTVFGTTTFVLRRPGSDLAPDGFVPVVLDDGTLVGQFGENNEPFEIAMGDQDLSGAIDVGDIFEIPFELAAGGVSLDPIRENRLSAFHLIRTVDSASVKFDSGTVKLSRPFKPYYVNGRKLPDAIDPTGDIGGTWSFKKRLFDRAFRKKQEVADRFTIEDVAKDSDPIYGFIYEGFHIFVPQAAVTALKSGDIATKETLEETVTLEAEQPDATPSAPAAILAPTATFDASADYPFQINLVSRIDLTPLGA